MKRGLCWIKAAVAAAILTVSMMGTVVPANAGAPEELVEKARITMESFMADADFSWLQRHLHQ
ncbi:MAG: hypothetical protein JRJ12_16305, partial [Deltaproteobacteria bacterium]|nr:hypothetical protein [Deltaproteobacteria bacterium]